MISQASVPFLAVMAAWGVAGLVGAAIAIYGITTDRPRIVLGGGRIIQVAFTALAAVAAVWTVTVPDDLFVPPSLQWPMAAVYILMGVLMGVLLPRDVEIPTDNHGETA